jgi:predicted nucleic acid-binding Zn finger protein
MTEAKKVKKAPKPKLSREEKAQLIIDGVKGRRVEGSMSEGFVTINSKGGRHSVVLIDEDHATCDCMDYAIRGRGYEGYECKHIMASKDLHQRQMSPSLASEEIDRTAYEMM